MLYHIDDDDPRYQACLLVVTGSMTIDDAAKQFVRPIYTAFEQTGKAELGLWETWSALIRAAAYTNPEEQGNLVKLLAAVRDLPPPVRRGAGFEVWGCTWNELPIFGPTMRESWDVVGQNSPEWAKMNAFAARITAADVGDFSLYGIWALREALEDIKCDEITVLSQSNKLEAAASWFIYAGKFLRALAQEGRQYQGRAAMPGKSLEDKNWNGYNEERWGIWLERFRLVADADIPEQTKKMITLAIKEMKK